MTTLPAKATAIETVQSLYAAFGRGDIPAIIAALAENVEWRINVDPASPGATTVPTFRAYRGQTTVAEFFATLMQSLEMQAFAPVSFMTGDREVAARILIDATVRSTGRRLRLESVHHWTFDVAGKVTRFIDFEDTLAVASAWDKIRGS